MEAAPARPALRHRPGTHSGAPPAGVRFPGRTGPRQDGGPGPATGAGRPNRHPPAKPPHGRRLREPDLPPNLPAGMEARRPGRPAPSPRYHSGAPPAGVKVPARIGARNDPGSVGTKALKTRTGTRHPSPLHRRPLREAELRVSLPRRDGDASGADEPRSGAILGTIRCPGPSRPRLQGRGETWRQSTTSVTGSRPVRRANWRRRAWTRSFTSGAMSRGTLNTSCSPRTRSGARGRMPGMAADSR